METRVAEHQQSDPDGRASRKLLNAAGAGRTSTGQGIPSKGSHRSCLSPSHATRCTLVTTLRNAPEPQRSGLDVSRQFALDENGYGTGMMVPLTSIDRRDELKFVRPLSTPRTSSSVVRQMKPPITWPPTSKSS